MKGEVLRMQYGVIGAALVPHPPVIIPEVGGRDAVTVDQTLTALGDLAMWIDSLEADAMVLVSPHGPALRGEFPLSAARRARGHLGPFGAPGIQVDWTIDGRFTQRLATEGRSSGLPVTVMQSGETLRLDHGAVVPLWALEKAGLCLPLVYCGMPLVDRDLLWEFGEILHRTSIDSGMRVVVVASGDLSHRLTPEAPSGYDPEGKRFDSAVVSSLARGEADPIRQIPGSLVERAGQCGYNPLLIALGSLAGRPFDGRVYSYEAPFGVGYAVVGMELEQRAEVTGPVELAQESLRHYLEHRKVMSVPDPLPQEMKRPSAAFVTFRSDGHLRGCIGTVQPTHDSLAEEIIHNAVSAGVRDPRFEPVRTDELPGLECSVDVLGEPERVDRSDLDPARFGVIVALGRRRGVLLPGLEGVNTVQEQLEIAAQKAGLSVDDPDLEIYRFEITRYGSK